MPDSPVFVAVDLGAGSGRVFLAGLSPGELRLEEIRRFRYPPRRVAGHLRWDFELISREIEAGLRRAAERARELARPVASIGIDSWGVDYGIVNGDGRLAEDPVCYRDDRTTGVMDRVFACVPRDEIFRRTGIQFLPINTLFQLYAHVEEGLPADGARLLMIPDLVAWRLTGRAVTEYTNATTTQLVNAASGWWDEELLRELSLPVDLLCEIVPAGDRVAPLTVRAAAECHLDRVPVVAAATHDTGSAVAGTPLEEGWAYVSSGTWSLVGVELPRPRIDAGAAQWNFTNEGGAFGTTRFLKNVTGLWLLECCRREWRARGDEVEYESLLARVSARRDPEGVIFPDDPRFLNPPDMLAGIAEQLEQTGQSMPADPAAIARIVLDSLALRYASVVRAIESLTGRSIPGLRVVGGGSLNEYLNQATADATARPVLAGPVEATVIGNAAVQAIAAGVFPSLAAARQHVATHLRPVRYEPRPRSVLHDLSDRYAALERMFETRPTS